MVWLVVEQNGSEYIYSEQPILKDGEFQPQKFIYHYVDEEDYDQFGDFVEMPRGSIKCLLGRELTFEESPYPFFNVGEQDMERVNTFKL